MKKFNFRESFSQGLIASAIALSVSAIGMVQLFGERFLLTNLLTMGQALVFLPMIVLAYLTAKRMNRDQVRNGLLSGLVIGLVNGLLIVGLIWLEGRFDIRSIFLNISPKLIELLTFGMGRQAGSLFIFGSYIVLGGLGAGLRFLPKKISAVLLNSIIAVLAVGMFSELLTERIRSFFGQNFTNLIFKSKALLLGPAIILFILSITFFVLRFIYIDKVEKRKSNSKQSSTSNKGWDQSSFWKFVFFITPLFNKYKKILLSILLLFLPLILGTYLTEITNNIGIFILMGLGLNIVVGLAGLLDLGYVAFFAIGAYTMAILTSEAQLGIAQMSFWAALPISVGVAATAGIILGMPVLRMRGDYLAIVTLGFGEIIRILALSDMLSPFIGGARGVLRIPKPSVFGNSLIQPESLYYVVLVAVLLAAFLSVRMRESRLGRRWMAMREDEDVAEAMGINLVNTKLLAFGIGAAFSGLAGAIFASKLTSIFPHSFNLLISINVLSLIIIGGLGSIPGTVVGATILVGLPELLREFKEFRFLMYGMLLIAMMLFRPEGFVPSDVIKRELHADDDPPPSDLKKVSA